LNKLSKIRTFVLDTLFPINCLGCGYDDTWLCDECLSKINFISFQVCSHCEKVITDYGQLCKICKITAHGLDGLLVASNYKENNIAKLVHLFKYNFIPDLHIPLGKILAKTILTANLPLPDIIIPIPLHARRLRFRGFNQAQLLAEYLSNQLTPGFMIPVFSNILLRKIPTPPQMKIKKYAERQANIRNAFGLDPKIINLIKGKNILLIDDIATTGATLNECARMLKQNGAKKIFGTVIARQSFDCH